ncbi:MAG: sulfatase [Bacteroidales bacterium]|nr:sulfatase [Bacteroidales bacterium]
MIKIYTIKVLLATLFVGLYSMAYCKEPQKNILFIVFDDLRPLIGAYGEPEPLTPNIDALAKEAIMFDKAYVNYPLCSPSRASMLTGIRFDNQLQVNGKMANTKDMVRLQTTWPKVLRDNGYWTATRGKIYHGEAPKTEKSSWDYSGKPGGGKYMEGSPEILSKIVDIGGRQDQIETYKKTGNGPASLMYAAVDGPDNILKDGQVAEDVIDYIKNKRDKTKPFMIACGFAKPHMPWVAPKKYFDMYPEDAGKLAYIPEGVEKSMKSEEFTGRKGSEIWNEGVSDEMAQKLIRGYMASTTYADAQMGKVIQTLKDEGLYENTIIIVWGDHGYHLTDHGKWRKNTGYNISLRCPLLIKTPDLKESGVVDNVVQNIDLYPTILELAGIEKPDSINLHGNSLVPLLYDKKVKWQNITYTCAQGNYGLVTDKYRFTITKTGNYYLFDLENDPHEWNNLAYERKYKKQVKEFENNIAGVKWNKP